MKYIYQLWFRNELIYCVRSKKKLLEFWKKYKEENNIVGEKATIKKIEIIPFRGNN